MVEVDTGEKGEKIRSLRERGGEEVQGKRMTGIQGRQGAGGQGRQGYRRDREDREGRHRRQGRQLEYRGQLG